MNNVMQDKSSTKTSTAIVPVHPGPVSSGPGAHEPHRPTAWWVWVLVTVVVIGAIGTIIWLVQERKAQAADKAKEMKAKHDTPVVIAEAFKGDLQLYLSGLGTVTPLTTVSVHTRVDGQIMHVWFHEGDMVKENQKLLEIDPRPYEAALGQAKGQLDKDQAELDSAASTVAMDKQAVDKGGISKQQLQVDNAAMQNYAGAVKVDNAAIAAAQVNVDYCTVTSPVDGKIGLRKVDEGNIVHAADTTPLVVIDQIKPITVVFTLAEDDLSRVQEQVAKQAKLGQKVKVIAFDRALTTELATGELLAIDSQIDSTSGTIALKAIFPNEDGKLYPQQFVNAQIQVETVTNAVLVPSAAIQPGASGSYVYVVKDYVAGSKGKPATGTVSLREVTVGPNQPPLLPGGEDLTVVESGVDAGDLVVIDGVDKLVDGAKVSPKEAPAPTTRPLALGGSTTEPSTMPTTGPAGGGGHGGKGRGHKPQQ
jgi:multidrug efflux system membrane fusion protein